MYMYMYMYIYSMHTIWICSLRSAGHHYSIPLCHTNLSSNRFFIRCARLWNSLHMPIDIISNGRLPTISHIIKHY